MDIKSIVDSYREKDNRDLIDKIARIVKSKNGRWDFGIDEDTKDLTTMLFYEYATGLEQITDGLLSVEFVIRKLTENMGTFRYGDFKAKVDDHICYDNLPVTSEDYKMMTRVNGNFGAHQVDYKDEKGIPKFSVVLFDDKQEYKTRDRRRFVLHGIDLSDLRDIRHTVFHEWTHIMEKSFFRASLLKKDDIVLEDGDSKYINANLSPDLEMDEYKNFISSVDDLINSDNDVLFGGISTIEINEKISPTRRIMHNQISEGATEYIALAIMDVHGFEVKDRSRYVDRREIVDQIFSSIGKKQAIADYLKSSNMLISMIESRRFNEVPLLQAADNMVTRLGKTEAFFNQEFKKCGKNSDDFNVFKKSIMEFWSLGRKAEDEDVDKLLGEVKEVITFSSEVSEDLGRRYIKGALNFNQDMAEFNSFLDKEFPVSRKSDVKVNEQEVK